MQQKEFLEFILKKEVITHIICPYCRQKHQIKDESFNQEEQVYKISCPNIKNQENKVVLSINEDFYMDWENVVEEEKKYKPKKVSQIITVSEYEVALKCCDMQLEEDLFGIVFDWVKIHQIMSKLDKNKYSEYMYCFDLILKPLDELIKTKQEYLNKIYWNLNNSDFFISKYTPKQKIEQQFIIDMMKQQIEYLNLLLQEEKL